MKYLSFFFLLATAGAQLISPCPRLFKYEPKGAENDRWYGMVTLLSDVELSGIWLHLIFDKPSIQLGNWFGKIDTSDNQEYLIKNRKHKLLANIPYNVRIYIIYNPNETPPQLTMFRLNGKTLCHEGAATTEASVTIRQLITSSILSTTTNPLPINNNDSTLVLLGGAFNQQHEEDHDFFHGDFSAFNKTKPSVLLNDAGCGTVVVPPRPITTYDQAIHEGEFPWQGVLYHGKGNILRYICGASLVTRYHLITAAHCVTTRKSRQPLDPVFLLVSLGKYYLHIFGSAGIQDRDIDKITVHPQYNAQSFNNNIAVLKVADPFEITNYIHPVCLWDEETKLGEIVNKAGTVVGWGYDEHGYINGKLTKTTMSVVSKEACIYSFPEFYSRFTSTKSYCAGFNNGTSVCSGDSGGGMVFPKSKSNPNNPVWQLRGLVSISLALQNQFKCDSSHYVVFTDVAKYLDWLRASLNN